MSAPPFVTLLGFRGILEAEIVDGVVHVRIDEETAPGRVREAHDVLEEKLASREPFPGDVFESRSIRVTAMLFDTGRKVLRVKIEAG